MNTLKVNPRLSLQLLNAALAERDFALVGHILHEFHNLSHFTAESAIVGALRLLLRHFPSQIRPLMQFLEKIQSVTVNKRILSAIALLHMKILVLQSDFHQAGAVGQEYLTETSLIKSGTANLICALLGQEYGIWNEFVATFAIRRLYNALINCIEPTRKINILNNWAIGIKLERDLFAHKQTGSINAQDDNLQIDKFEQQLEKETFNQIQQIIAQSPNVGFLYGIIIPQLRININNKVLHSKRKEEQTINIIQQNNKVGISMKNNREQFEKEMMNKQINVKSVFIVSSSPTTIPISNTLQSPFISHNFINSYQQSEIQKEIEKKRIFGCYVGLEDVLQHSQFNNVSEIIMKISGLINKQREYGIIEDDDIEEVNDQNEQINNNQKRQRKNKSEKMKDIQKEDKQDKQNSDDGSNKRNKKDNENQETKGMKRKRLNEEVEGDIHIDMRNENQVQNADEKGIISAQEMAILCGRWLSAEPNNDWPLLMLHWFWKNGIGDVCVSDIAYALVMRIDSAEIIINQNHNVRDRCNQKEVDLVLQAMNQDGNDSEHKKKQQQRINQLYEREIIRRKEQTRSEMIRDEEPIQEDELNDNQNNIDIQQQQTIESNTNIDDEQFIPLNEWVLLLEVLERLLILSGRKNIFDERLNDKIKDKQIKINNKQRQTKRFIIIRDDDSDEGEVNENINVEDIIQQDQQSIDQNSFGDVYNSSHIDMQLGKRGALEVLKTLQTLTSHWRSIHFKRRMTQVSISKTNENKDILEEEKEWEYFAQCIEEILNTDGLVTAVAKARVWQILFKQQEIYQSQSRDQYGLDYYDIIMRGYHEGWFDAVVDAERTASGADNCFNEDNKISLVQLLFKSFGIE